MRISQLVALTESMDLQHIGPDVAIFGMTTDSRQIAQGELFAALSGTQTDGRRFIAQAIEAGAVATLHDGTTTLPVDHPQLLHPEPRRALAEIAAAFYGHPARALKMIGITGSNGKTTVAAMVESILTVNGMTTGVIGTTGIRYPGSRAPSPLTTPEPITLHRALRAMVDHGCKAVVAEVSSHALTQHRTTGIPWQVAAFTNLTRDHLDHHGTMENYWQAKSRLFLDTPHPTAAVINRDDPFGEKLVHLCGSSGVPVTGFSLKPQKCDGFYADAITLGWTQSHFDLITPGRTQPLTLGAGGRCNIANALTAAAICWNLGFNETEIVAGLAAFRPVRGRLESICSGQPFTVIVDFAHTPDALEHLLNTSREITPTGKRILVFGCGG
ncbi:MAG: UDP-N-acetylmuramoyl-L-alanyl-D-glutamate--2,6-diaminopimelate ligase, partial [Magnetococcales bacterium]|nr:UDP-N-acetylmuramoyl-L-alanyl-D-glutamate--2,6-diaminopimelate ligase [Magnetococcales bacterium]